jgi:hypothetical protein
VIAAKVDAFRIGRIVHLEVEHHRLRQAIVRIDKNIVQFRADAVGADGIDRVLFGILVIAVPTDHIHI